MDVQELFFQDGKSANVWLCGKCGKICGAKEYAESCCQAKLCQDCGNKAMNGWLICQECREKKEKIEEQNRIDKAEKINEADYDGFLLSWGDDFYYSIEEFLDECESNGITDIPQGIYACKPEPFPKFSIEDIYECYEDYYSCLEDNSDPKDHLEGVDSFQEVITKFNELNKGNVVYMPDYTRVIIIDEEDIDGTINNIIRYQNGN
jgi:hypothetical protein